MIGRLREIADAIVQPRGTRRILWACAIVLSTRIHSCRMTSARINLALYSAYNAMEHMQMLCYYL